MSKRTAHVQVTLDQKQRADAAACIACGRQEHRRAACQLGKMQLHVPTKTYNAAHEELKGRAVQKSNNSQRRGVRISERCGALGCGSPWRQVAVAHRRQTTWPLLRPATPRTERQQRHALLGGVSVCMISSATRPVAATMSSGHSAACANGMPACMLCGCSGGNCSQPHQIPL